MPTAYYNELDPYPAQWLRNLISNRLITPGMVDCRDIKTINPAIDLSKFTRCHFFAGIAGWERALEMAGWPADLPVWTGSAPCPAFSVAGKRLGFEDPRHLWPDWCELIRKFRPPIIFGEQVTGAGTEAKGKNKDQDELRPTAGQNGEQPQRPTNWVHLVRSDLEEMGYSVGFMPIEAASAGADHYRDRYWFVAYDPSQRGKWRSSLRGKGGQSGTEVRREGFRTISLADSHLLGPQVPLSQPAHPRPQLETTTGGNLRPLVHAPSLRWGEGWTPDDLLGRGIAAPVASVFGRCGIGDPGSGSGSGPGGDFELLAQYIQCPDEKFRRLPPPAIRWLGTGILQRVGALKAYGNSIDPRPASAFIRAFLQVLEEE